MQKMIAAAFGILTTLSWSSQITVTGGVANFCSTVANSVAVNGTAFFNNLVVNGSITGANVTINSLSGSAISCLGGATGPRGATGAQGAAGKSITGATGATGPAGATTIVNSNSLPHFKLLIYYGYPSLATINTSTTPIGSLAGVAQAFAEYDVIVLGAGIESATHPDHNNTATIISLIHAIKPSTLVFGYIDLGVSTSNYTIAQMETYAQEWQAMGVNGIFWDDAGYDFGNTRVRQNTMILFARSLGLASFMNAWNPDDIFSSAINTTYNPLGTPSVLGGNDWFLLESLPYLQSTTSLTAGWIPRASLASRISAAQAYRTTFSTKIAAVAEVDYSSLTVAQKQYLRAMTQAIGFVASLDAYGDCAEGFSASGNNANIIYKSHWDLEMGRFSNLAGPQPLLQDTPSTFNRHDYETIVTYVDGQEWYCFTPALTAFATGISPSAL